MVVGRYCLLLLGRMAPEVPTGVVVVVVKDVFFISRPSSVRRRGQAAAAAGAWRAWGHGATTPWIDEPQIAARTEPGIFGPVRARGGACRLM